MIKIKRRKEINGFSGKYRYLSNFWPCVVHLDGEAYPSLEHAYQAAKTLDEKERAWVRAAPLAGVAKTRGRKVIVRKDWERKKKRIMFDLVMDKFSDKTLGEKLLETGSAKLIEANNWGDTYWGVCNGVGKNNLGKILMRARHELRKTDRFRKVWMLWN